MVKIMLGLMFLCLSIGTVWAQETPLKAARDEYTAQINTYRKTVDKFSLDKAQFEQSPSSINQELLLGSAKELLAAQAQVWFSYFKALIIDAKETTSEPEAWQEMSQKLNQRQAELSNKLNEYNLMTDKPAVNQALSEANTLTKEYKELSTKAIILIKFYRIRYALDQVTEYKNKLADLIPQQILEPAQKEAQLRALAEADRLISEVETGYAEAVTVFETAPTSSNEYLLDRATEDLVPIYGKLVRAQKILKEASMGIEI